jgi:lipopolysaccharide export system permease protein
MKFMFMAIWERYFLRQLIRMFFLFLLCFYGLYVLIDYASHINTLAHHHTQIHWQEMARYYFFVFASRAEILLPLALLIAFVYASCTLNSHHELVAFMASGFSIRTLMRPFMMVGLLCVLLMYANEQFILPKALRKLRRMEDANKHTRSRTSLLTVHHLILEDGSLLIFQDYDTAKERFFDVYWIQSIDSIYRIKFLSPTTPNPIGYFVDHMVRQKSGELLQEAGYRELSFPNMKFNPDLLQSTILDPDILSLSELATQRFEVSSDLSEKESKTLTAFYWKLMMPWLCLLAIIAPAPFCIRFSRQLPIFLIYICSLFGLIAFYMFMDAAQVIAKRQIIAPLWAICGPFLAVFVYFGWRFKRMESSH